MEEEVGEKEWREEVMAGGSLKEVPLEGGAHGWACPPGHLFQVRGPQYLTKKQKVAAQTEWVFRPLGVDWLKSDSRLDHVLHRHDNRVARSLEKAQQLRGAGTPTVPFPFVFAVNLQVPGHEHHSAVFYFFASDRDAVMPPGSLLRRFALDEDDAFRDARFKLVNRVVKGPWLVRAAVGNHAACLLGKALKCRYHRAPNYLEIDVDIGSSALASAIVHLALGYVSSVAVDMAFIVEAQSEDELPEQVLGAIRLAQIEMAAAIHVEADNSPPSLATTPIRASSWKKLSRGLSFLGNGNKSLKAEDPNEDQKG